MILTHLHCDILASIITMHVSGFSENHALKA